MSGLAIVMLVVLVAIIAFLSGAAIIYFHYEKERKAVARRQNILDAQRKAFEEAEEQFDRRVRELLEQRSAYSIQLVTMEQRFQSQRTTLETEQRNLRVAKLHFESQVAKHGNLERWEASLVVQQQKCTNDAAKLTNREKVLSDEGQQFENQIWFFAD